MYVLYSKDPVAAHPLDLVGSFCDFIGLLLRVWDTSMAHRVCIGYMHSRLWTNTRLRQITPSKVSLTLAASHVTLPSLSAKKNQYQPDCVPELALGEHEASPMLPRDKPL